MDHVIPELDSPFSWTQPDRTDILVGDTTAIMTQRDYELLYDYSRSRPSGAYPGKMWKSIDTETGKSYLHWYGLVPGNHNLVSNHYREIMIGDWKTLFGVTDATATGIKAKFQTQYTGVAIKKPEPVIYLNCPT